MRVKFWGTRGSIPTPGRLTEKYGGNTACVEVSFEGYRLILDGGTGIRELGLTMQAEGPSESALLFSHLHWDHIQGLPFFVPFFAPGYTFHIYSPPGKRERMNAILYKQMSSEVFPVQFDDLSADIRFERLPDDGGTFGPFHITSFSVNHPGDALAYRIQANDLTVIYATDNELDRENHPDKFDAFVEQVRGADLLIADAQYDARELTTKRGWGHSAYEDVLAMARAAEVRRLAMTHHDPMRDDETLARIERTIRHSNLEMNVFFARDSLAVAVRKS